MKRTTTFKKAYRLLFRPFPPLGELKGAALRPFLRQDKLRRHLQPTVEACR